MSKTDHLAKAKSYIAKGEDFYRRAAEEIVAAKKADPALTDATIAEALGRHRSWVSKLTAWVENGDRDHISPFGGETQQGRREASVARKVAREHPEALVAAIAAAPAAAQRKIADELIKQPSTEKSLRSIAKRSSEPSPKLPLPKAEAKAGDGVFRLWEACELLLDEAPSDDERVRITALFEKALRLSEGGLHLLGTGELEDEFRALVEEVRADA